jgi:hypothetical protein
MAIVLPGHCTKVAPEPARLDIGRSDFSGGLGPCHARRKAGIKRNTFDGVNVVGMQCGRRGPMEMCAGIVEQENGAAYSTFYPAFPGTFAINATHDAGQRLIERRTSCNIG